MILNDEFMNRLVDNKEYMNAGDKIKWYKNASQSAELLDYIFQNTDTVSQKNYFCQATQ